ATNRPDLHSLPTRRSSDLSRNCPSASPWGLRYCFRWHSSSTTWRIDLECRETGADQIGRYGSNGESFMFKLRHQVRINGQWSRRSEEHTSELQSRGHLVCR